MRIIMAGGPAHGQRRVILENRSTVEVSVIPPLKPLPGREIELPPIERQIYRLLPTVFWHGLHVFVLATLRERDEVPEAVWNLDRQFDAKATKTDVTTRERLENAAGRRFKGRSR